MKKTTKYGWKAISLAFLILSNETALMACDACKKQQPKLFQGITHGPGPDGATDYFIITLMALITIYVLYASVKCMLRPEESAKLHIKRMILND